jgi:hypothetical protein
MKERIENYFLTNFSLSSILSLFVSRFRRIHSALDSMLNVLIIDEGKGVIIDHRNHFHNHTYISYALPDHD